MRRGNLSLLVLVLLLSKLRHKGGGGDSSRGAEERATPAQVVAGVGVAKRCALHGNSLEEEGEGHGHQG